MGERTLSQGQGHVTVNDVQLVDIFLTFPVTCPPRHPRVSITLNISCRNLSHSAPARAGLSNLREYKKRVSINIVQILHRVVHLIYFAIRVFEADESLFSATGGSPVCPQSCSVQQPRGGGAASHPSLP